MNYKEACDRMHCLIETTEHQVDHLLNTMFPDYKYDVTLDIHWEPMSCQFVLNVKISQNGSFYVERKCESAKVHFSNDYWDVYTWTDYDYYKELTSDFNENRAGWKICNILKKAATNSVDVISDWLKACSEEVREKYKGGAE